MFLFSALCSLCKLPNTFHVLLYSDLDHWGEMGQGVGMEVNLQLFCSILLYVNSPFVGLGHISASFGSPQQRALDPVNGN